MSQILDWIEAKRLGLELDEAAIRGLVTGFTSGDIPDYQMSAWLMAVTINGMTLDETCSLTDAMLNSGETLDLSELPGQTLDKHSSGGVGDKVTLALVPMLAASGTYVAKMSGHGLGLTGGTLDKLESVPGVRTQLSNEQILNQVREIGACLCAQSETLAPADRALYALRDVTGTVAGIPLIASSIMSKKLACGAGALLLDIKVGTGAFMASVEDARRLAEVCIEIGARHGKRTTAVLSDMNQPLGRAVGNSIELLEAAAFLNPSAACSETRLATLIHKLYGEADRLLGWEESTGGEGILTSGEAYEKLQAIIDRQGGDFGKFVTSFELSDIDADIRKRWKSGTVLSEHSGIVQGIDAGQVARCAAILGASRERKGDSIDHKAGIWLTKSIGDSVASGEPLAYLNSSDSARVDDYVRATLRAAVHLSDEPVTDYPVVLDVIRSDHATASFELRKVGLR